MGNFLKAINEAIPTNQGPTTGKIETGEGLNPKPADEVKKGGFLNKVASAAQKSANFIQKGAQIAKGNWDINNVLQGILDKQLDSSTSKLGSFGKPNFNKIKLGNDVVEKINAYGQGAEEEPAAVEANEGFLSRVNEAIVILEQRDREELEKLAKEKGIPIVTKSGKKVRLDQLAARIKKSQEDEPEKEQGDDEPAVPLTTENAIFELAGRTGFGDRGVQYTLKPVTPGIKDTLESRGIKYLTFLLQTKDNEFKAPEGNTGIVYAYDDGNQLINEITSEGVKYQWNGQEKLYTLSTDNKELAGVKYSEGQYPINKSDVKPLTDGKHILMRPDEKSGYMKFAILQDLPTTKQFLINFKKGVAATPEEVKEAEAVADPSPVQKTS
jgi:hypothetical protein